MSVGKSFGAFSRPTARISGRSRSAWSRARCARYVHRVRDHDRPLRGACSRSEPGFALALRDADRHGRQRLDQPVDPAIEPGRTPECAAKAQPCTVKIRTGTRARTAARRPSTPAFELLAWRMSGRSRRSRRTSSKRPARSRQGLIGRRTFRSGRKRAPAASAASRSGPDPCAATATSKCADERREQRSDVGLRPADLGQRDDQQHPGSPPVGDLRPVRGGRSARPRSQPYRARARPCAWAAGGRRSSACSWRWASCSAASPLPLPIVLGFGVGLLGTLALALARYDAAVALGVLLLAVVRIEPAPSDLVFGVLIALAFVDRTASPRARAAQRNAARERIPRAEPARLDRGDRRRPRGHVLRDHALPGDPRALARRLRLLGATCAPRARRLPRRSRALGRRRLPGADRAVPRRRGLRGRPARAGPLQGSERLRAVPRPRRPDPDGGDRRAAPVAVPPRDEARAPLGADRRSRLLVLACRVAQPRRRHRRPPRRSRAPPRRSSPGDDPARRHPRRRRRAVRSRGGHLVARLPHGASRAPGLRHAAVRRPGSRASRLPSSTRSGSARASSSGSPSSRRTAPTSERWPRKGCWARS